MKTYVIENKDHKDLGHVNAHNVNEAIDTFKKNNGGYERTELDANVFIPRYIRKNMPDYIKSLLNQNSVTDIAFGNHFIELILSNGVTIAFDSDSEITKNLK